MEGGRTPAAIAPTQMQNVIVDQLCGPQVVEITEQRALEPQP